MKKVFLSLILFCNFAFAQILANVSVSIAPLKYFVDEISNKKVNVNVILPPNANAHNFEFKPNSLKELEKSSLYFGVGLEFEKVFLEKFKQNYKSLKIVNVQKNINLLENHFDMKSLHEISHENHANLENEISHANLQNHANHKHEKLDIHTWLDPILAKQMAINISEALSKTYPNFKDEFKQNLNSFLSKLDILNEKINNELKELKNREFIVYHPSWGYFANRYNLVQIPVEIDGKEPKTRDLQSLIKFAKEKNIKAIFVQPGFSESGAKMIASESGAKTIMINHLASDYENELLKTAKVLKEALN